jgi:DNA-binding MarR family transcriptional regulator
MLTSDLVDAPCYCKLARRTAGALTAVYERELEPFGLTLPQFSLLRTAGRHAPIGVSDLAGKLHLDRTTLARNLKLLEKMALITFAANREDQREKWVVVTVKGKARLAEATVAWNAAQGKVTRALGKQNLAALVKLAEAAAAL